MLRVTHTLSQNVLFELIFVKNEDVLMADIRSCHGFQRCTTKVFTQALVVSLGINAANALKGFAPVSV